MDLRSLEARLLRLLPQDALQMKLPLVQERLRELAGAQDYALYEKIVPPDKKLEDDGLREYLKQLVNEFHFRCQIRAQREKLRSILTRLATLGIVLGLVVAVVKYVSLKLSGAPHLIVHFRQS